MNARKPDIGVQLKRVKKSIPSVHARVKGWPETQLSQF
jgi:hypothetical protein